MEHRFLKTNPKYKKGPFHIFIVNGFIVVDIIRKKNNEFLRRGYTFFCFVPSIFVNYNVK